MAKKAGDGVRRGGVRGGRIRTNEAMGFVDAAMGDLGASHARRCCSRCSTPPRLGRGSRPWSAPCPADQDASVTSKHGVPHHGYKGRINAGPSKIVVDSRFGTAKEHDGKHIDDLTLHERTIVLADSAYSSTARRAELRARGVIDGICDNWHRGQERLHEWQERWNALVASGHAHVEHPHAMLKHQLGYRRVRYRGLERNAFDFAMTLTACNLKRSLSLKLAAPAA